MNKKLTLFLLILILPLSLFAEKSKPQKNWEFGFKSCIDTVNIREEEEPFFACGNYIYAGRIKVYPKNDFVFRWNIGTGHSYYVGFQGNFNAALSTGYAFLNDPNKDLFMAVLGTVDFQTYCYKTPFFALGVDLYGRYPISKNLYLTGDFGLFYDYSFVSFMTKAELGLSLKKKEK